MFLEDYFNSSETNLNDITCYRVVLNILDSKQNYSKDRYIELIKNISTNIDNNQTETETETEIMQDSININYDNNTNQKKDNDICETMTETVTESLSNS